MFDQIKSLLGLEPEQDSPVEIDKNVAAAALMVHVIAADGKITSDEDTRFSEVLEQHYALSPQDAAKLEVEARKVQSEAIDLYSFTSIIKNNMDEGERLSMIENLWEMVYADGKLHEFEDNVVWRVAELIGIQSRDRMVLKKRVLARLAPEN